MGMTFTARSARKPASSRHTGAIFAVGGRAFVNDLGGRENRVSLLDEKGTVVLGSLVDGAEVEILGWLPRGTATRYHVRSTRNGLAGWLGAGYLRSTRGRRSPEAPTGDAIAPVWIPPRLPDSLAEKPRTGVTPAASTKAMPSDEKPLPKRKARRKAPGGRR